MANFGILSKWHRVDNTEEMDTFRDILKEGDILQMKNGVAINGMVFYYWAVCTQDGAEPKMRHIYREGLFRKAEIGPKEGWAFEVSLTELSKEISIRINNTRDSITAPKPLEDIVGCAKETVNTKGDGQFGTYDSLYNSDIDFVERVRYPKEALDKRLDDQCRSQWYTEEDYESFSWLLRVGDMVEFNRKNVYSHWAMAINQPQHIEWSYQLVHRYGSGDASEVVKKLIGTIMLSPFKAVIKGSRFRINNSWDMMYTPKDAADIQIFALESVRSNAFGKYNLAFNNCRHFAMQARYRITLSKNTGICTEWVSSEDIRLLLSTGDIIEVSEEFRTANDWDDSSEEFQELASGIVDSLNDSFEEYQELAIFVERTNSADLLSSTDTTTKTAEVAYLSRYEKPDGSAVVRLISWEDFLAQFVMDKNIRINNEFDHVWKQSECEDIVKYVVGCNGKEDPYFVVGARYGKKVREEIEEIGGGVSRALRKKMDDW